jgi:glycosyltransferase involved in cell wall biosynthesis
MPGATLRLSRYKLSSRYDPRVQTVTIDNPRISAIVVCKNDDGLRETLSSLTTLSEVVIQEFIVVDASRGKLDYIRRTFPTVLWHDYVHEGRKLRTIAEQRSVGLNLATGKILVFIDANCVPVAGWMQALTGPLAR